MAEYFIKAHSFAAPFVSEEMSGYQEAETPEAALRDFAERYRNSLPVYAATAYASADDYHRGNAALAQWRSNKALAVENASGPKSVYSDGPGWVEINGERVDISDPYAGRCV